jgi:predicted RNase H-like nuclease (RuvC/YqgF family)
MKRFLFKVREFVWVIVSEIEDWVYPYRTRLSPEEKYEHGMKDPMTGEITMIENLLQADNERIQRLQDEMINVQNRVYQIEQDLKSINTYSEKSDQFNPNERQKSGKEDH